MDQSQIIQLGDELYEALSTGKTVTPLTSRGFEISIEDAYHIQQQMLSRRIAAGEKVIGKKIDNGRDPMIHTMRGAGYVLKPAT